jgi:hypothetical protein
MSLKQYFSKWKMKIGGEKSREVHSEFQVLKFCTGINRQTTWILEWGLFDSMKLKHKMNLWTNMKFPPQQNQKWWGFGVWHIYWDQRFEPFARYSTYYPSCSQDQSYMFLWRCAASSTLFPWENWVRFWKEYFLPLWIFKVEIGSLCYKEAYSAQLMKHMYLSKKSHLS